MITMRTEPLELRGAITKQSKTGKKYAYLNVEDDSSQSYQFFLRDIGILNNFKKGDKVVLVCEYTVYEFRVNLSVVSLEKANG